MAQELDVIEASLIAHISSVDQVENVFQFQMGPPASPDDADMIDDILEIMQSIAAIVRAVATAITVWNSVRIRNISTDQVFGIHPLNTPLAGNASGEPNASQLCQLLTLPTGLSRVVLRKYLGPLAEVHVGPSGFTTSSGQAVASDLGDYLLPVIIATNANWIYGHFRDAQQDFIRPSSYAVTNVAATQRRRRRGVGI